METQQSMFEHAPDIQPQLLRPNMSITDLLTVMGQTCFEARNVARGARLFQRMIEAQDTIWLGIAGAGIAGGLGGMVINLLQEGFINVICSTGAQVYHDLHFAFGLPVKAISPRHDDDLLRQHGDTRIYDIGIREIETLEAQDQLIQKFVRERYDVLEDRTLASWEFNYELGTWVLEKAAKPDKSFVATAARLGVPLFWDSQANHSIAMNLARLEIEGFPVRLSSQKDILDSAAITFNSQGTGFVELGGGGPKNFIQQTGPTIQQILGIDFEGADRGLQIGTAVEREGSLSSCTFSEAVTWGKYRADDATQLVQIWAEYSLVFPLLVAHVLDACSARQPINLVASLPTMTHTLKQKMRPAQ
ncbi:deoxyhypusine synthase family protein [bacterium]|nr:deoxyhypusine synthase family protein [bacterium]